VDIETVGDDAPELKTMILKHFEYTSSALAGRILKNWDNALSKFVKVIPKDYKRMMMAIDKAHKSGLVGEEALMAAFDANNRDLARVAGN
jgi:glutamate synthase (NADPH/NADH) large chain